MAAFPHFLKFATNWGWIPKVTFHPDGPLSAGPARDPRPPDRLKIGLALSSGAAKGLAHIGVIQVLEENGIEVDAISGTSMGAYIGSLYAAGYTGKELEELTTDLETAQDVFGLVDPAFPPRRGFLRGKRIAARLRHSLGDLKIEDMPRTLRIIATELVTFRKRVFAEGDAVDAVSASIAIPGICVPVELDGVEYVDGAIADPLPVQVIREHADFVIGVTVLPSIDELDRDLTEELTSEMPESIWKAAGLWANRHLNYFARGNLLDILRRASFGSQIRLLERSGQEADVLIRATAGSVNWHDYQNAPDYIRLGREAAEAALPEIQAALMNFQPANEQRRCA